LTKEAARKKLAELVEQFSKETNLAAYQEEDVKTTYIYPFLQLLGYSNEGKNHAEWEIHTESKTKRQKKVDYEISINSEVRFLVEAKRPSINLHKAPEPTYQIKNYCLHKRVPIGLLTDFEEFMLYFNITSPNIDRPKDGLLKAMRYTEYLDNFDFIYDTLSKEAVLKDSLAILVAKNIPEFSKIQKSEVQLALFKIKGREELDKEFLQDLDDWRKQIAQSLATNNKKLIEKEITAYTQKLIDRILFIKITEDKDITDSDFLLELTGSDNIWPKLLDTFKILNSKFNGSLFTVDDGFVDLNIDNQVLYDFIRSFYYTGKKTKYKTPKYHFDYIPVEILGSIYERFLGQQVKIQGNRKISIEEKKEVKKAGGVYYTPEYIVKFIVENTIGQKIKDKKPEEIAKMSFLDPACGSGSFLINTFNYLIKYHEQYYSEHPAEGKKQPEKKKKYLYDAYVKDENNRFILTTDKKAEILQNNIYGVDIDPQAVEVTKLSLYIKMIEEGQLQIRLLSHPVLPSMDNNIKCGNSLIGHDIYHGESLSLFVEEQKEKINAFDWNLEFSNIQDQDGFDCIIGNPPYGADLTEKERQYLFKKYGSNNSDTACLFMYLSNMLIKKDGINSFIVPKPFIYASNWQKIREALLPTLIHVVDCGKVWRQVKLEQVIYLTSKASKNDEYLTLLRNEEKFLIINSIQKDFCFKFGFILNGITEEELSLGLKLFQNPLRLNNIIINQRGAMYQKFVKEKKQSIKVLGGKQIQRYETNFSSKGYIDSTRVTDENAKLQNNSVLVQNIVAHIENPKPHLKVIATVKETGLDKFIILDTVNQLKVSDPYSSKYVLAIINSKLMSWYAYRFIIGKAIRTIHYDNSFTDLIPLTKIDLNSPNQKAEYLKICSLVDSLLKITSKDKDREVQFLENQLDQLIYKLYDLTVKEIKIIEESSK
jgi:adenine-specific DNA-methyltransferase